MTAEEPFFDFLPRPQVPLQGSSGQTAATQALASAAYRDSPVEDMLKANNEWHESEVKKGKLSLFEPNLGEAFSRAVQSRMLGATRKGIIQSFGIEPQTVVEHCLASIRIRKQRDTRLTLVMVVFGLLFLPGLLIWLGSFQLRRTLAGAKDRRVGALGTLLLAAVGIAAVIFLIKLPFNGFLAFYLRAMLVAPIVGWYWAKRICEKTALDLRSRWDNLLGGGGIGAKIPEAVPKSSAAGSAEHLRQSLVKLAAEDQSNVVFYAGPKGILGMGTRWGSWQLAEELLPKEAGKEIHGFRSWDVIRAIQDRLLLLERGPLHSGGFPTPSIKNWVVSPIGEGAKEVSRPSGQDIDNFQVRQHEIQRICNEQQFSSGNRHYLGVQFTLWDGQLVITMMVTVTVLHETLRIEVTGHALGPVHALFTTKPAPKTREVDKTFKFWEKKTIPLPLVDATEVVRLAARAPLTWYPPLLDYLGGRIALPEPFGLRHAWADQPWRHRFMADDAMRAATPVLRVVHAAAMKVLDEHGVNTDRFTNRSLILSGMVQDAAPRKADWYDA